jgi:hypothetical protein
VSAEARRYAFDDAVLRGIKHHERTAVDQDQPAIEAPLGNQQYATELIPLRCSTIDRHFPQPAGEELGLVDAAPHRIARCFEQIHVERAHRFTARAASHDRHRDLERIERLELPATDTCSVASTT